jgi:hypothetical protein
MPQSKRHKPMSSLDSDFDTQMNDLELEWRQGYEASIEARAHYQTLAAAPNVNARLLEVARERLERAEAVKARIMVKIERLENQMLSWD